MNVEHLVRMVNEIGAFYASEGSHEQAARSIETHLKRFWDPRMRAQIVAHYAAGGEGLDPAAREAVAMLASASSR
jgi:formate dehydrogenase subunit delta